MPRAGARRWVNIILGKSLSWEGGYVCTRASTGRSGGGVQTGQGELLF